MPDFEVFAKLYKSTLEFISDRLVILMSWLLPLLFPITISFHTTPYKTLRQKEEQNGYKDFVWAFDVRLRVNMRREPYLSMHALYEGKFLCVMEVNGVPTRDHYGHTLLENESDGGYVKLAKGKSTCYLVLGYVTKEFMQEHPNGILTVVISATGDGRKLTIRKSRRIQA